MKRKLIALLLTLTLAVGSLTACGGDGEGGGGENGVAPGGENGGGEEEDD